MKINFILLFLACLASISLIAADDDATPRIFGGEYAEFGQFPSICFLTVEYNGTTTYCGANIILDGFYLLTVAHCVDKENYEYPLKISCIAGVTNLLSNSSYKQVGYSLKSIIHKDYDPITLRNDVALIQLKHPYYLTKTVKDVLPALKYPDRGSNVVAAGWGLVEDGYYPNSLRWTILQYLKDDVCYDLYPTFYDPPTQICAGTTTGNDTCDQDGGGPLYTSSDPKCKKDVKLLGLTSYGGPCGAVAGAAYTSVPSLAYDWVKTVLSDHECYENCKEMKHVCYYKYGKYKCSYCYKEYLRCNKMCHERNRYTF